MTEQPRTRHPIQVSIEGTRADGDGHEPATLVAIQEAGGTWLIDPISLNRVAVRLTEVDAARLATAILHVLPRHVVIAVRATAHPQGDTAQLTTPEEAT